MTAPSSRTCSIRSRSNRAPNRPRTANCRRACNWVPVCRSSATQKNFSAGNLQQTGQPLDMAINGRGFFQVLQPDGTTSYTRDGTFHLDSNGQIVTANGFALEPAVVVPPDAKTFTVGNDGTVSITVAGNPASQVIGNLQTADFINPAGLQAMGNNLFLETASSGAPQIGTPGLNGFGTTLQSHPGNLQRQHR